MVGGQQVVPTDENGSGGHLVGVPADENDSSGQQVGAHAHGILPLSYQELDGSGGQHVDVSADGICLQASKTWIVQVVVPADGNLTPSEQDLDSSGGQQVAMLANGF